MKEVQRNSDDKVKLQPIFNRKSMDRMEIKWGGGGGNIQQDKNSTFFQT